MKRYMARVTEHGTTHRFPIFAESYDIAKRKLKALYPAELLRLGKVKTSISPYQS